MNPDQNLKSQISNLKSVSAFAPATVANVVCGFDVFGFAVDNPGDVVTARWMDRPGVFISKIEGDGGLLPRESAKNTASVAAVQLLASLKIEKGVEIELQKNLPLGSGMGSSASSAVAALVAAR